MPVLGRRRLLPFGSKARAQAAAIANRRAAVAGKTFTTIGATTATERRAELRDLFPLQSRWMSRLTFVIYAVVEHAVDGTQIMTRLEGGGLAAFDPSKMRVEDWERLS